MLPSVRGQPKHLQTWKPSASLSVRMGNENGMFWPDEVSVLAHWCIALLKSGMLTSLQQTSC